MGVFQLPTLTLWGCYTTDLVITDRDNPTSNPSSVARPGGGNVNVVVDYGSKSYWSGANSWIETDLHANTNPSSLTGPCSAKSIFNKPPHTYFACGSVVKRADLLTANNPLSIAAPTGCSPYYINGMYQTDLDANTGEFHHGGPPGCNEQSTNGLRGNFVDGNVMYWCCQTAMYTTVYTPPSTAHLIGDPHFLSFAGGDFDVKGVIGVIYVIWVDKFMRWNARFVARRSNPSRGTQLGECGLVFPNATLLLSPEHNGVNLTVDGLEIRVPRGVPTVVPSLRRGMVVVHRTSVVLHAPCLVAHFLRTTKSTHIISRHRVLITKTFHHYNVLVMKRTFSECNPHGLLGQTYNAKTAAQPKGFNGEGVIEGTLTDYVVPSLFARKSKF
eukprot:NODE_975_length_1342_cov_203.984532_g749_i2.p1 GENE.NODE_975_length_1342_cov_203.984532_g749_i2~~NODE_975_length_1342_cov_203.984532_g749_i2.p1  ORF type:complete len:433 (-),score=87.14 NODE_975_length_1342_cov_203.984532_g749_i2:44-1198(-)